VHEIDACDVRLVWCQRIVKLGVTCVSGNDKEGPRTHAVVLNGNALLILSLEGVPEETNSKVHSRGPHTVSVRPFIGTILASLGNNRRTETPS